MVGKHTVRRRLPLAALTIMMAGVFGTLSVVAQPSAAMAATSNALAIHVLSTRPDLVSGGAALVEVTVPSGADATGLVVERNGTDVSSLFATRANGKIEG